MKKLSDYTPYQLNHANEFLAEVVNEIPTAGPDADTPLRAILMTLQTKVDKAHKKASKFVRDSV